MTPEKNQIIDASLVAVLLKYDPDAGKLFWLQRDRSFFTCNGSFLRFNKSFACKEAFTSIDGRGYKSGRIFDKTYHGHRVAWAAHYGEWPLVVDHINGDRRDNRIINLRNVTKAENALRKAKNDGEAGVSFCKKRKLWRARVTFKYNEKHLGYFEDKQDALSARAVANQSLGFTYY